MYDTTVSSIQDILEFVDQDLVPIRTAYSAFEFSRRASPKFRVSFINSSTIKQCAVTCITLPRVPEYHCFCVYQLEVSRFQVTLW